MPQGQMKPAPFDYVAPPSVSEAAAVLRDHPDEAKIIAGGQSLVPMMNFRLARPEVLVDIGGIDELRYIRGQGDWLAIGALTTEHAIETSGQIAAACPVLTEASRWIGHPAIRHRGTVGGSLAHSDPSAEYPLVAALLDAVVVVAGDGGARQVPFSEFCLGHYTTALTETEIVTEVRFPVLQPGTGWAFLEIARRTGDFALASAAVLLRFDGGTVVEARVALGGAGPTPVRARQAEALLLGRPLTDELIAAAAGEAAGAAQPTSDMHGSADFRRNLCQVLAIRGLKEARRNVHG
jgi:aerobic carbon-monoxide dehydrogenase medium subunit